MVNSKKITFTVSSFRFINQRTVRLKRCGSFCVLSKSDVISSIKYYIWKIHQVSDKPIRCEGVNYNAFKMHDLVPYLYTLINLYLTICSESCYCYHRYLPELKLTRFCHLPFESDILVPEKVVLNLQCALLDDPFGVSRYCCVISGVPVCGSSLDALLHIVSHRFPSLVKSYEIHFVSP